MIQFTIETDEGVVNYWKINYLGLNFLDQTVEVILGGYLNEKILNKKPLQTKVMKFDLDLDKLLIENSALLNFMYVKILELEEFVGGVII